VRLVLDEHVPVGVAAELRSRGHDAVAVAEDEALRSLPDDRLWQASVTADRTLVTYDIEGFSGLATAQVLAGRSHPGLILCSPRAHPPTRDGIGRLADAIERAGASRGPAWLANLVVWLMSDEDDRRLPGSDGVAAGRSG
jgi:hypothetical protein